MEKMGLVGKKIYSYKSSMVSFVRILEKTGHVITALHCTFMFIIILHMF